METDRLIHSSGCKSELRFVPPVPPKLFDDVRPPLPGDKATPLRETFTLIATTSVKLPFDNFSLLSQEDESCIVIVCRLVGGDWDFLFLWVRATCILGPKQSRYFSLTVVGWWVPRDLSPNPCRQGKFDFLAFCLFHFPLRQWDLLESRLENSVLHIYVLLFK